MKVIVCLDERDGMLFNRRRQSSDRELCKDVHTYAADHQLWMNAYSGMLFTDMPAVRIAEDFLFRAGNDDYCFVEDVDLAPYLDNISEWVIYRWNRLYPSDTTFPIAALNGFKKLSSMDFSGSSHEKITKEVYVR